MLFDRTFHPDEANQAFTVGRLLETGLYTYKPTDHHGPTLYYAAAPLQQAFGHTTTAQLDGALLRCTPLLFAVLGLVLLALTVIRLVRPGRAASRARAFCAVLATVGLVATAPMFVFYATDFIQETLLVAFTLLMFWSGTGYCLPGGKFKRGTWALLFGIGAGLAFATKETCVLSFAAGFLALLPFLVVWVRRNRAWPVRGNDLVLAFLSFLLTAGILFSSLGRDFTGLYNAFVAAPLSYVHRAAGDAASEGASWHVHPWWQYLQWIFAQVPRPEMPASAPSGFPSVLLKYRFHLIVQFAFFAAVGFAALFRRRGGGTPSGDSTLLWTFLGTSLYSLLLLAIYSAIPYKTPWCSLQILVPLLVADALGAVVCRDHFQMILLERGCSPKSTAWMTTCLFLLVLPFGLVVTEHLPGLWKINADPDSATIPYNYAHASPEAVQLAQTVAQAMRSPVADPLIAVALPPEDTWPFPWYNRTLEAQTGYWTKFEDLVELERRGARPSVVLVPMREGHLVQPLFPHLKHTKRFFMRPGVRIRVFW